MLICDFCIDIFIFIAMHTPLIGRVITFDYNNHLTAGLVQCKVLQHLAQGATHGLFMQL